MLNYLEENFPPGCQREQQPRESAGDGTDRPGGDGEDPGHSPKLADLDQKPGRRPGPPQSAASAAVPASAADVAMEVGTAPEPSADESPEEEVTLEAEIMPEYDHDLPDYDE